MTWQGYSGGAYGGAVAGRPGLPANAIAVPGYSSSYYWERTSGTEPYGAAAYGGQSITQFPSAGLLAAPDPASGTVTVWAWWAFAGGAQLSRVGPQGSTTPLRTSPLALPGGSRRNLASNPKARDALDGYQASGGNTTVTRADLLGGTTPTGPIPGVADGVVLTAPAAGTVAVSTTLDPAAPVATAYGFYLWATSAISSVALTVTWYDKTSTSLGAQTYPVPASAVTAAYQQWSWCTTAITTWPTGASVGVVAITVGGVSAGSPVYLTARIIETGAVLGGNYFDGDFAGCAWTGTPGLSYSDQAPIVYTVDAECPLDVPVQYSLSSGAAPGYAATSTPVTLASRPPEGMDYSRPWSRWLTHPAYPTPIRVWIESPPTRKRGVTRGVFTVMDSPFPVVVSGAQRQASTGTIVIHTQSHDDQLRLEAMLSDTTPVLLRAPAGYGVDTYMWCSLGDETDAADTNSSYSGHRSLSFDYIVTAPPAYAS